MAFVICDRFVTKHIFNEYVSFYTEIDFQVISLQCVIEEFCYDFSFHQHTVLHSPFSSSTSSYFLCAVVFTNFIIIFARSHDFADVLNIELNAIVHWNTEPSVRS